MMKKALSFFLTSAIVLLFVVSAMGHPKVVVVPLTRYMGEYKTPQTRYLTIAGSQCTGKNLLSRYADRPFSCELNDVSTDTDAYWDVNLPNGAVLTGFKVYVYSSSDTTTCNLKRGTSNIGTTIASVSRVNSQWGWTDEETTFSFGTVDTESFAYGVHCTRSGTIGQSAIGSIRIRYTITIP